MQLVNLGYVIFADKRYFASWFITEQINMNSSQSSNSQGNSQQDTQREQDQTERVGKLKGGTMHVAACGKKTERDLFMTLDLVFKFDGDPTPKVVGEFFFL